MTLTERYDKLCATPSSINEHLPLLRDYASRCKVVAEFGVDIGQSTTAFLMGYPKGLISVDVVLTPELETFASEMDGFKRMNYGFEVKQEDRMWVFAKADSRTCSLCKVDLLLIDSDHCYAVIKDELERHHAQISKWIAIHDTFSFGQQGADGGIGIVPAIGEFLVAHPEWVEEAHYPNNNGLQILRRIE